MIDCPKCGAPAPDTAAECPRCGIVFAKFVLRPAEADADAVPPIAERPRPMASDPLRGVTRRRLARRRSSA